MKKIFLIITFFTCICPDIYCQTTTIFITRHADRNGDLDQLTAAGVARAQELKRILIPANITSIYSTEFQRTKLTAKPLADHLGITTAIYTHTSTVANQILTPHTTKNVLVIGHSNTIDSLARSCGCSNVISTIPSSEFDNLYIVTVSRRSYLCNWVKKKTLKDCRLVKLKYGANTTAL